MMNKVTIATILMWLFGFVIVFHFLVLTGVIPYTEVWGGRLKTPEDMYRFEAVSILINALILFVLYKKRTHLINGINNKAIKIIIWVFVGLFVLNTVGNFFAVSWVEKLVFTPITLLSAVALYYINK